METSKASKNRSAAWAATRLSIAYACAADVSLLLGGSLKRRERLSARLADVLSQLVLISATLRRFKDEGYPRDDLPLVHWGVDDALHVAHEAFAGLLANYPNRFAAWFLRALAFAPGATIRACMHVRIA